MKVLGIAGSIRRESYNRALLEAARQVAPHGMSIEVFDLARIPLYNADLDTDAARPDEVVRLKAAVAAAEALLIVTPEYNYSVPGVLQNAIDWASRPPEQPFDSKPIAIMGASPGMLGSARAQSHLRQCFVFLNAMLLNRPEVMIANAASRF